MKKPKSIVISIPKPCSENWDRMTPFEKGRYCSNCEKVVTDLTRYTDKQLLDFISNSKGSSCGKLNSTQLNREIVSYESGNSSFLQRLFLGTALATTLSACNESGSNLSTQQTEQHQTVRTGNNPASDSNAVIAKVKENPGQSEQDTLVKKKSPLYKEIKVDTEIHTMGIIAPLPSPHFPDSNAAIHGELSKKQDKSLNDYIIKNINYPQELADKGIEGTVYVNFIVEKSGKISNVYALRGANPLLDSEAVKVIRSMPKLSPGEQNGHPVRVSYIIPIHFKVAEDSAKRKK